MNGDGNRRAEVAVARCDGDLRYLIADIVRVAQQQYIVAVDFSEFKVNGVRCKLPIGDEGISVVAAAGLRDDGRQRGGVAGVGCRLNDARVIRDGLMNINLRGDGRR